MSTHSPAGNFTIRSPDRFVAMPWKNGLGKTVELLRKDLPGDAGFAWRLSIAEVVADGDFSSFPGYDRTLVLLQGNGMTLTHEGGNVDVLDQPLRVARFGGDEATTATLHDGPIKDFNVMTRRKHCAAKVEAWAGTGGMNLEIEADVLLIYAPGGELCVTPIQGQPLTLRSHHLLVVQEPGKTGIGCSGGAFVATHIRHC